MQKRIKKIYLIIAASVLCGFLIAFLLPLFKESSTSYVASQAILSPDIIENISLKDIHPKTNQIVTFSFNQNEFVYFDYLRGSWIQKEVSLKNYAKFYQLIALDANLSHIKDKTLELFQKISPTALITSIRTNQEPAAKILQIIQFIPQNYFRIKVSENSGEEWAYFYHADIYKEVMTIFTGES